jgi:hypothetical protein
LTSFLKEFDDLNKVTKKNSIEYNKITLKQLFFFFNIPLIVECSTATATATTTVTKYK